MRRHGTAFQRGIEHVPCSPFARPGVFGRLFPTLPSYDFAEDLLVKLGQKGGIMDAGTADPVDNPKIPAGMVFLGQFIDHDITFDPTSSLERQNDPEAIHNFRTPLLELDSVYGSGPEATPYLYQKFNGRRPNPAEQNDPAKLLIGSNDERELNDLPRNGQGVALIGDPRNDENLIISQLHLAFLKFHNNVVDYVREQGVPEANVFEEAQRLVRWHYQWIIVHEFLPLIIGQKAVNDILEHGRQYYFFKDEPFIPVEFAVAAYRFGHSQIRAQFTINEKLRDIKLFPDLSSGFEPVPAAKTIDWSFFFAVNPHQQPQASKKIDSKLASVLFDLPFVRDERPERRSLAARNLLRSESFALPWGQRIAKALRATPLSDAELGLTAIGFPAGRAPLWYYILKEAEVQCNGEHLGEVGGRIVGEVLIGLLQGDFKSYLSHDPCWEPVLPAASPGSFTMADLLRFAGVAPAYTRQTYTVQSGDTLRSIASHFYKDETRWRVIYEANRDKIRNPDVIHTGVVLTIPA